MYGRITRIRPVAERFDEAERTLDSYLDWLHGQPEFVLGLRMGAGERPSEIVRLVVWTGRGQADETAQREHSMAVRSQLRDLAVDQAIREEQLEVRTIEIGSAGMAAAPAGGNHA